MNRHEATEILTEHFYAEADDAFAALLLNGDREEAVNYVAKEETVDDPGEFVDALIEALVSSGKVIQKSAEQIQADIRWRSGDPYFDQVRDGHSAWAIVGLTLERCSRAEAQMLVSKWEKDTADENVDLVEISKEQVVPILDPDDINGVRYVVRWRDLVFMGAAYVSKNDHERIFFYNPTSALHKIRLADVGQIWRIAKGGQPG